MLYSLQGTLSLPVCDASGLSAVVDCGGVGYKLSISANTYGKIAPKAGENVKLFTHMSVRDDAIELYGFADERELGVFRQLIGVSGIGPKAAMSILSTLTPEKLTRAVTSGDAKAISSSPGVGAKTAARVILELKDKLKGSDMLQDGDGNEAMAAAPEDSSVIADATNALTVLGYSRAEVAAALKNVETHNKTLDDVVRDALRQLFRG